VSDKTIRGGPSFEEESTIVTVAEPQEAARLATTVALAYLASAVKDGLLGLSAYVGLMVMRQVMEDELARHVGPKDARLAEPTANSYGTTTLAAELDEAAKASGARRCPGAGRATEGAVAEVMARDLSGFDLAAFMGGTLLAPPLEPSESAVVQVSSP
jgi:hypothetical protein